MDLPARPRERTRKRKYVLRPIEKQVNREWAFPMRRHEMIVKAAEALAAGRAGGEGDTDRDWLEAEAEVERRLGRSRPF